MEAINKKSERILRGARPILRGSIGGAKIILPDSVSIGTAEQQEDHQEDHQEIDQEEILRQQEAGNQEERADIADLGSGEIHNLPPGFHQFDNTIDTDLMFVVDRSIQLIDLMEPSLERDALIGDSAQVMRVLLKEVVLSRMVTGFTTQDQSE